MDTMSEEISLRELIEILIKRKTLIIATTIIAILAAGIVSFFVLDPVYETRMVLMASQFTDKLQTNQVEGDGIDSILNSLSQFPTMTLETYRQQIKAPRVMRETIANLDLGEEYDIESLANAIHLETVKDTNLITIKMEHQDPEKAAEIINKVGENFVNFVSDKAKEHATNSSAYVEGQLVIEKEKLEEVLKELQEFLSEPRGVSELDRELEARLEQITEYKTKLTDLKIRQQSIEAALPVANKEAGNTNRIVLNHSADGSINNGQLLMGNSSTLLKIEKAEVEADIKNIGEAITTLQQQIEDIQVELQEKKHEERLINHRVDLAEQTYDAFVKKYEELRVTESSQIGDATITIISRAYPTTKPVGPRKALNVAIAAVLGVMIGTFIAFFKEYWESTEEKVQIERS